MHDFLTKKPVYSLQDTITYGGVVLNGASDLELYLLLASAEYLLATKDADFLKERIPYKFKADKATPSGAADRSALEVIAAAYKYLTTHTGVGPHGLIRVQSGDWNDGFAALAGCRGNAACQTKVQATAESVMNSAMATHILDRLASALEMAAVDPATIDPAEVRQFAKGQQEALLQHAWNGDWLDRAWLPNKGFIGTNTRGDALGLTLEPQPWILLSSSLNASDQRKLVAAVERGLKTRIGYKQSREG